MYGKKLAAIDGVIGHVRDFYFDDRSWALLYVVADTGSWLVGRQVLLSPHAFKSFEEHGNTLQVMLRITQIEDGPSIEEHKPVSRRFEEEYYAYYAWPTYWQGPQMWGMGSSPIVVPPPDLAAINTQELDKDAHLRSTKAVTGYKVEASDGTAGHITSFMFDSRGWAVRDIVAVAGPWYMGREILINLSKVERISYEDSKVYVKLSKADIRRMGDEQSAKAAGMKSLAGPFPDLVE